MQTWEYRILLRQRAITRAEGGDVVGQWDKNIIPELPALGEDGWELVTVVSRSSDSSGGRGGVTTEEQWILKRPKNPISSASLEAFERVATDANG
ncbi:MAG TPA: hypothetical protein VMM78_11965 [Thermomicrobiales bacterium]|nr:hypothetical protein [Thermomicrobiales bacterium]